MVVMVVGMVVLLVVMMVNNGGVGLTGCLQGGDVFVPSDFLHVQPAILDLLSHCCQHVGPQSLLVPCFSEIVSFLLYKSE